MYKAVIFDCFGVLTTDHWKAFVDGLPPDVDKQKLKELNRQLDASMLDRHSFLEQVFEVSGSRPQQVEELLNNEQTKNTKLLEYIRELRQRGLKTGLLSNISTDWITSSFLTEEEQKLFDAMTFSYEARMAKPDPDIFMLACERLDIIPAEAIFTDDVEAYCQAAESLGMASFTYEDFDSCHTAIEKLLANSNQ